MKCFISQLKVGQRFNMEGTEGVVLKKAKGYAQVRIYGPSQHREFKDSAGAVVVIDGRKSQVTEWSPLTRVEPVQEGEVFNKLKQVIADTEAKVAAGEPVKGTRGKPQRAIAKRDAQVIKDTVELKPCRCGCGEMVKRTFKQGHDARWHGWERKVADGRMAWDEAPVAFRVYYKTMNGLRAAIGGGE